MKTTTKSKTHAPTAPTTQTVDLAALAASIRAHDEAHAHALAIGDALCEANQRTAAAESRILAALAPRKLGIIDGRLYLDWRSRYVTNLTPEDVVILDTRKP